MAGGVGYDHRFLGTKSTYKYEVSENHCQSNGGLQDGVRSAVLEHNMTEGYGWGWVPRFSPSLPVVSDKGLDYHTYTVTQLYLELPGVACYRRT